MPAYRRADAKAYARQHLRGIWAAALTPFRAEDLAFDEAGFRRNPGRIRSSHLGRIGSVLLGTLESHFAGTAPGNNLAVLIG